MADAVIGSLRVLLGLDTAAFTTGTKKATSELNQFISGFKRSIAGLSIAGVAYAFERSIKSMIDEADNLGKASQKFGVPVEQLSALKYAAELADVSFEQLGKGLGKLSRSILDGVSDPAGQAAKQFQALGIAVRDTATGQVRPSGEVFLDIAEKFSKMEDGATKTALAIKIFGRAGAELIPLLNEGRSGIKSLTDEAAQLGIVITAKTAASAQEFNDNLKRLHTIQKAVFLQIAEGLIPGLDELANKLIALSREGRGFQSVGEFIGNSLNNIYRIGLTVAVVFNRIGAELMALNDVASTWPFTEARARATERWNATSKESSVILENLRAGLYTLPPPVDAFGLTIEKAGKKARVAGDDINMGALAAKSAVDSFIASQQKHLAAQQVDIATTNALIGTREAMRVTMEAEAIAAANNITLTNKQREALKLLSDQAGMYAVQLAGVQLTQQNLTPFQLYQDELRKINQLYAEQAISAETAGIAAAKAASRMTETYGQFASTAAGNFATFFKEFGKGNKAMFAISKAFSVSQAIINTYVGATKALAEGGPFLGPVLAASIVALGLAQVAKIVAEKPPAMALGGSLKLGGAGGVDSQMVSVMMTPGEKMTVDQNKYGEGSGSSRTITLQGLRAKEYYRGDVLRDFVENLNEAIGDGLKIKLV